MGKKKISYRKKRIFILLLLIILLYAALRPWGKKTFLLIGMDNYGSLNDTGRSDVMMAVQLDFTRKKITAVTFARDILLNVDNRDLKINTIVRSKGEEGLVNALEESFGMSINGWFRLNFSSLVSIIDAVGGVPVQISEQEAKYITHEAGLYPANPLSEGDCLLNGAQSLSFVRCRKLDNDLGRGNRQSRLVSGLVKKSRSISISEMISLFREMNHAWRTSLSMPQQIRLLSQVLFLRGAHVERVGIPFEGMFHYGDSSTGDNGILLYLEKNRSLLHEALK